MAPDDLVLVERRSEHVLVLTINQFTRRNAFDGSTARALEAALDAYDEDPSLRAAVLTGASGVFRAGQDLKAARIGDWATTPRRGPFGIVARPPSKPVVAAVEGAALGGGLELALSCDLVVAAEGATMGLPEVRHSLVAAAGGLLRLPRRIPYHIAMELALTGDPRPARFFYEQGLANRLVPDGEALQAAVALAHSIEKTTPMPLPPPSR